jgi:23S rRNA (cytosine1962-C5)-methyltransferase
MRSIRLKKGRERSLLRKHPWIFSGAVQHVDPDCRPGDTVEILSSDGIWLARAAYSPHSQIAARVWTFEQEQPVDPAFFKDRLGMAFVKREELLDTKHYNAYRACYAESDGLPGLIVDRYSDWLVVQFLSAGAERWREEILGALQELFPGRHIMDRSDADVRQKEGLPPRNCVVKGEEPIGPVQIKEGELSFLADLHGGHKTGLYLDQRQNRAKLLKYCKGKKVLNCFSYTGGFGLYALSGEAEHVHNIDTSEDVLKLAAQNYQLNGFRQEHYSLETADVFTALRKLRDSATHFDIIILDPPKFISSASQIKGGSRGYKDINLLAMKLLRPGGYLFTFSCSGLLEPALFQKIIADAATDSGRDPVIVDHMFQSSDLPVSIRFPEGLYLKGLILKV